MEYAEIKLASGAKLLIKQLRNGNVDILLQNPREILVIGIMPITSNHIELKLMKSGGEKQT